MNMNILSESKYLGRAFCILNAYTLLSDRCNIVEKLRLTKIIDCVSRKDIYSFPKWSNDIDISSLISTAGFNDKTYSHLHHFYF